MRDLPFHDSVQSAGAEPLVDETFQDDRRAGTVVGSRAPGGVLRLGVDAEGVVAIDHGALRFQPLVTPGWARQGIAYGPFRREAGLTFAVAITNGHNTSQAAALPDDLARRLWRWLRGPGADPVPRRLRALVTGPRRHGLLRRFAGWVRTSRWFYNLPDMDENLALGWFSAAVPRDPVSDGCGFVVHAALGDNGELWTRHGDRCAPAFRGLKNTRAYYVVVLREQGAIYYAASGPDAASLPAMPMLRPVAIDARDRTPSVYAGVHQCVLGQIGFRVDTRVHDLRVQMLPDLARAAPGQIPDALTGEGPLDGPGSAWRILHGGVRRTPAGAIPDGGTALAVLAPQQEAGLIHALIDTDGGCAIGLVWRFLDERNHWALEFAGGSVRLIRCVEGEREVIAAEPDSAASGRGPRSVQISDTGSRIGCCLEGVRLFGRWIEAPDDPGPALSGLSFDGSGLGCVRDYERHPRAIPAPEALRFAPPWRRFGSHVAAADRFAGAEGEVDERAPDVGDGRWSRVLGRGELVASPAGARVVASVAAPNPGRTFHCLAWPHGDFADVEATILPPGTGRGQKEHCRSGVVLWQDTDNYLTFSAYLADEYEGASIALFTKRHGYEELYDAIWTMVGDAVNWGQPFRLRVICDGERFAVFLDGEAILEHALTDLYPDDPPLRIKAVGLATNWEWGDDTGSVFQEFTARF